MVKSSLWVTFAVVAGFMGFLLGYSIPPMQAVGIIGDGLVEEVAAESTGGAAETQNNEDYYQSLQDLK